MSNVIDVKNLSKKYVIGHQQRENYTAMRDVLVHQAKAVARKLIHPFNTIGSDFNQEEFWALKYVSFDVKQGDRLGVIGRNGAGKSTLLKILSRITEPTEGKVTIKGRIASLLEVGTGFHPELTGRENIYLNGAILGMSKRDITRNFDEIVAFADIEKFLDTPVKRYSSGMYVRLAFAVAAHLEPEILVVDEVLAVGDASFQKRCLGKMRDVGKDGRTVLFVSHNMSALKSLCDKTVWLDQGRIVEIGASDHIVSNYLQHDVTNQLDLAWSDPETAPGKDGVVMCSANIRYPGKEAGKPLTVNDVIDFEFEFLNQERSSQLNLSVALYNEQDVCVLNTISTPESFGVGQVKGGFSIPGNFLNDGFYRVRLLIVRDQGAALVDMDNILSFEVHDERNIEWYGKWEGVVRPKFNWRTNFKSMDLLKNKTKVLQ